MAETSTSFTEKHTASKGQRRRIFTEDLLTTAVVEDGKEALKTLSSKMKSAKRESDQIKAADSFLKYTLLCAKDGYEYQEDELDQLLERYGFSSLELATLKEQFRVASINLMRDLALKIFSQRDATGNDMVVE